jgi:SAM-dependent methyltransferase
MRHGDRFDVVMLTAVWIHLDPQQRREAMPRVASLLRPGGVLLHTLRHGPAPPGRRLLFETSADETIALSGVHGLHLALKVEHQPDFFGRREITWTSLAFRREESTRGASVYDALETNDRAVKVLEDHMDYYDLGSYTRKVTTAMPEAQLWFDRGLNWLFGFTHLRRSGRARRRAALR